MNLVFGNQQFDSESYDFWHEIVIPKTRAYFGYQFNESKQVKINMHQLYYALLDIVGLEVTPNILTKRSFAYNKNKSLN